MNIRIWQHKKNKTKVHAVPWWEILEPIIDNKTNDLVPNELNDRQFKIGALIQVGWLLKNPKGVWLGVGPDAQNYFDDIGIYKPRKKAKKK